MTQVLLVPINVDAFYADGATALAAPLADFTKLPYNYAPPPSGTAASEVVHLAEDDLPPPPPPPPPSGAVNSDQTFLSDTVFRAPDPGSGATWTPPKGIHLHWALPDALTTQRVYPGSGGKSSYPRVPNRWLVVLSTQSGDAWSQQKSWVIESDYLYPDQQMKPASCGSTAISFPIMPPDVFTGILSLPVPPPAAPSRADYAACPEFYKAPYRCMGRCVELSAWQADSASHEYLSDYNPAGLSAIGYGHPLFAAMYPNCFSVFGFHDDLTTAGYPRRYDIIGWYDDSGNDCMTFFQNLPAGTKPWDALKKEYNWVNSGTAVDDVPVQSVYYSRIEIDKPLNGSLPAPGVTLTVGNTATEALSAYLSQSLVTDVSDQITLEEQLEAICLAPRIAGENIDLQAKFTEARHDKGFKKIHGGSIWSVRAKSTCSSAQAPSGDQDSEVTLPDGFAYLLNALNDIQMNFDASLDVIDSLRRHAFTDWYRFEYQSIAETGPGASLPQPCDIVSYSVASVLTPLQQRIAATGEVVFGVDPVTGKATASVKDNSGTYDITVQYSMAQQLVQALQNMAQQLGNYNAGQAATQANLEYYLVRKGAPRFYQPADPAVLLEGPAVVLTQRHDTDDALNCSVYAITESNSLINSLQAYGISSGAFNTILTAIDSLAQGTAQGFKIQNTQPWNPITIEWAAQVWPEERQTSSAPLNEGITYNSDYIAGTWELDVNDADLKLNQRPSGLGNTNAPNPVSPNIVYDYTGRSILVSHAPQSLQNAIAIYMMPLSLGDLKTGGLRANVIDDDLDYQYDVAFFNWAATIFGPLTPPAIQPPASLPPEQLAQQQSAVSVWLSQQHPFAIKVGDKTELIDLATFVANHPNWCMTRPVIDDGRLTVFSQLNASEQAADPLVTAVNAYLAVNGKTLLSQALSGFNDALLTQQREFQLPVWDWRVVNTEYNAYARDIALSIGKIKAAPLFEDTFLPIRSGLMQISGLTIVDSFGQVLPLTYTATQKSERMAIRKNLAYNIPESIVTDTENSDYVYLAPRLTQESRLNFRWLSADQGDATGLGDEQEMNDHPATTPVCGWILPNNLDYSLAIYANDGTPLGSLVEGTDNTGNFAVVWQSAPGTNNYMPLSQLPNPHLLDFATNIIAAYTDKNSWEHDFLSVINDVLKDIDPKSFAQHSGLSLLIARPMALVRATIGLQAKGLSAVNHAVEAFNYDQVNNLYNRFTGNFDDVIFPVRLGERSQLNDGLVAYWVEDGNGGYQNNQVHFPEEEINGPTSDFLPMAISGTSYKISMLLDPRGVVHATSGVLPVKSISIPPEQYASVLSKLSVTFFTSPLITPVKSVQFPLPAEPGYGWSWLDRPTGFTWNRVADIGNASRAAVYGPQRILEGWLKLTPQTEKQTS